MKDKDWVQKVARGERERISEKVLRKMKEKGGGKMDYPIQKQPARMGEPGKKDKDYDGA